MPKRIQILFVAVLCAVTAAAATKAVFLTGGQSNSDGRLYAETLPSYLQTANNFCLASNHWPYSSDRLAKVQMICSTVAGVNGTGSFTTTMSKNEVTDEYLAPKRHSWGEDEDNWLSGK